MFDVTRELSKLPSDVHGVCEVAERFITGWFGPLADTDGYKDNEIEDAEYILGLDLPPALRWAYSKLGHRDDLLRRQDPLMEIANLRTRESVLVFREENQRNALWGVRVADTGDDDPPVVWKDLHGLHEAPWQPYQDRLSVALLELILGESMFSHGRNVLQREAEEGSLDSLPAAFQPLPELDHILWPLPEGPEVRWFGSPDVLLRSDGETWFWVFARTPSALADARTMLPGTWEEVDA